MIIYFSCCCFFPLRFSELLEDNHLDLRLLLFVMTLIFFFFHQVYITKACDCIQCLRFFSINWLFTVKISHFSFT